MASYICSTQHGSAYIDAGSNFSFIEIDSIQWIAEEYTTKSCMEEEK